MPSYWRSSFTTRSQSLCHPIRISRTNFATSPFLNFSSNRLNVTCSRPSSTHDTLVLSTSKGDLVLTSGCRGSKRLCQQRYSILLLSPKSIFASLRFN
jgi:hypothetical protein